MTKDGRHPNWPRPGHAGELHEWAVEMDTELARGLETIRLNTREEIIALAAVSDSTHITELLDRLEEIVGARVKQQLPGSTRFADVFDGEAYNG